MLYNTIKALTKKVTNTNRAIELCGKDPIANIFGMFKKIYANVKVDKDDVIHVSTYGNTFNIKRVEKSIFSNGEMFYADYIIVEAEEYIMKYRITLEKTIIMTVEKKDNHVSVSSTNLPKWLYDVSVSIAECLTKIGK